MPEPRFEDMFEGASEDGFAQEFAEGALPDINARVGVRVVDCCSNDQLTRVENVVLAPDGAPLVIVAAPWHPCGLGMPLDGTAARMRWSVGEGGGALEVPVMVAATRLRPIAVWELKVTGPAVRVQRRRYVRVSTPALPVELGVGERRVQGWLADLSEGGLRCTLERWAAAALDDGGELVAHLRLPDGLDLELPARIVRVSPGSGDHVEVACEFTDIPERTADQLRRFVFAEQLRQRRREAGLDA